MREDESVSANGCKQTRSFGNRLLKVCFNMFHSVSILHPHGLGIEMIEVCNPREHPGVY